MQKPRKSRLLSSTKGEENRIELSTSLNQNCRNQTRGNQGMPVIQIYLEISNHSGYQNQFSEDKTLGYVLVKN